MGLLLFGWSLPIVSPVVTLKIESAVYDPSGETEIGQCLELLTLHSSHEQPLQL